MNSEATKSIPTIVVTVIVTLGTIWVAKINKGKTAEYSLIQELQEERTLLTQRVERLEEKTELLDDYNMLLRTHIINGNPPPPPEYPSYKKKDS